MSMQKRAWIEDCVDYILSQDHEREDLVTNMIEDVKQMKLGGKTRAEIKKELYSYRQNHIFYKAKALRDGVRLANHAYKSCMADALEAGL